MRIHSSCIISLQEGEVLTVTGSEGVGLPGGKLEPGETPEDAARRELREETGLDAGDLVEVYRAAVNGLTCVTYRAAVFGAIRPECGKVVAWEDAGVLTGPTARFPEYNTEVLRRIPLDIPLTVTQRYPYMGDWWWIDRGGNHQWREVEVSVCGAKMHMSRYSGCLDPSGEICVEGSSSEMRGLADAIELGGWYEGLRCGVETADDGVWFSNPKYCVSVLVTHDRARDLAKEIIEKVR